MSAWDNILVLIVLGGLFALGYCYYKKISLKEFFIEIIDLFKYAQGG